MEEDARDEGVWIGNKDWGVPRWAAILAVLVCGACAVGSVMAALDGDAPISASSGVPMFIGTMVVFLPTAILGRRRSPGIRLLAVLLLLCGVSMVIAAIAAEMEPGSSLFEGRGEVLRGASVIALFFLPAGGYFLWKSFHRIEPTDHEARHAERD